LAICPATERDMIDKMPSDSGVYLFALELPRGRPLNVGSLGTVRFKKGWYVYVGSAKRRLSRRLARHMNKSEAKALRWHIDYLRNRAQAVRAFPIATRLDLECRLARDVAAIAAEMVPRFGCSDCSCPSHLFRFEADPLDEPQFVGLLRRYKHRIAIGR
jgi:sugar fermentation stimulation protein A